MAAGIIAAAGAAAGAAAKQMADTLERFRVADATAPDRAQSLDSLGLQHLGVVSRLTTVGVICPGRGPVGSTSVKWRSLRTSASRLADSASWRSPPSGLRCSACWPALRCSWQPSTHADARNGALTANAGLHRAGADGDRAIRGRKRTGRLRELRP